MKRIKNGQKPLLFLIGGAALLALVLLFVGLIYPEIRYQKGVKCFEESQYADAIQVFSALDGYKNSEEWAAVSEKAFHYERGLEAFEQNLFREARAEFRSAEDYLDAGSWVIKAEGAYGNVLVDDGHIDEAIEVFQALLDYEEGKAGMFRCADFLKNSGKFKEAAGLFSAVIDYEDSIDRIRECAESLIESDEFLDAAEVYSLIEKSGEDSRRASYAHGRYAMTQGDYGTAVADFTAAAGVFDSRERLKEASYLRGKERMKAGDYAVAKNLFRAAADYLDAEELLSYTENCVLFTTAEDYYFKGELNRAKENYEKLPVDFSLGNVSVSERLNTLKKYDSFVKLCGEWEATEDSKYQVRQVSKSYGLWDGWTGTAWNQNLQIRCIIGNGYVRLTGNTAITVYTNYSISSQYLKTKKIQISIFKDVENLYSSVKLDDNTTFSFIGGKVKIDYSYTDRSDNVYFDYVYTSNYVYEKTRSW